MTAYIHKFILVYETSCKTQFARSLWMPFYE